MSDPTFVIAVTALVGLTVVVAALLRAWHEWLALKRQELDRGQSRHAVEIEGGVGEGAARIEIADLKERIRKLEAIASGVDL
ncbi:hypothetical protein WAB17_00200 [Parerythrobacter aurantius]|uniref:hypothetical protein n=1 Tax=Parerythrobacter aurantius TaxID=3127706 RepID=UPI00324AAA0C